ncbi:hypothetical protein IRJ41_003713 [Triplophysa rosa]|uniref:Uncharacterized protein n=1 Tax=Triplophysa rosa TaxID=992332 RepID=A0A9W7WLP8_TRIRA|nr:hypothetical protein IRJ41_003713 [Triplophysa rosa]
MRYAIFALRAAHALDLSLGVHLKDLRESRIQWSKRGDRLPVYVQPNATKVERRTALLRTSNQVRARWDTGAVSPGASESHNNLLNLKQHDIGFLGGHGVQRFGGVRQIPQEESG